MSVVMLQATCLHCNKNVSVEVDRDSMVRYLDGEAPVQVVFPEASLTDREIIMAQRTGFYVCDCIWKNLNIEEEGVVV